MKKKIQWTFVILILAAAFAAAIYSLVRFFMSTDPQREDIPKENGFSSVSKSFYRHYTQLKL